MNNGIQELDALRGFAALAVVFLHYTMGREQATLFFRTGCIGVDLFFIISGFVILMTLQRANTWKDFLIGRFSRLYPAYWISVSLVAALGLLINVLRPDLYAQPLLAKYMANMTMFQYYFDIPHLDNPYWTLTIEMQFYSLMLIIFASSGIAHIEKIGVGILLFAALFAFDIVATNSYFRTLKKAVPLLS